MSHREQLRSPYQRTFQKECRAFVKRAEATATANHARKYPDNHEIEPNSGVYKGLVSLLWRIARVKDTGLDMVAETPRCSLVLKQRSYWFIQDLADQTEFEDECDDIEAHRCVNGSEIFCWNVREYICSMDLATMTPSGLNGGP